MFGATPAQLREAFKKPLQDKYVCTDCKQPICESAYMHTDMTKPDEGWRHYICPIRTSGESKCDSSCATQEPTQNQS